MRDVGAGKKVKIDKKWRIVIPREIRKNLNVGDEVTVSLDEKGRIIIEKANDWRKKLEEIKAIKLHGDKSKIRLDAAKLKGRYEGKNFENNCR